MKIYTRSGDSGDTALIGGTRVLKSDARVEAYGCVDELNSALGLVLALQPEAWLAGLIVPIQRDLFAMGSILAAPDGAERATLTHKAQSVLDPARVQELERAIDQAMGESPPLRAFVLPGGTPVAAALHVARAVCRRSERRTVALHEPPPPQALLIYLNRLSDLLFALARRENARAGLVEERW